MGVGSRTSGEGGIGRPARIWLVLLFCLSLVCVGGASAAVTEAEAQETNAAPVAKDNEYRVKKDGTLRISNPGVLRNDLDPDGDRLSASRQSSPRHGRLSLRSGGSFVYTPDKGYRGKDSFVYEAADATGGTDTATVEITVWSPDRLPLARNNAYGVEEDKILTVPAPGVLKNDAEAYGRSLFATKVTDPGNGSLSLNRDGSFVYTPDADFDGEDSFVYRARDNKGHDDQGTVRIAVGAVNDAPVFTGAAGNTSQTIDEGAELAALEATDADGDTLTFELTGGSLPPGITLENGGRFAGVAGGRAAGNYTADIKVSDGDGEAANTRLEVTVNPVEEAAVASDADVTTDEDVAKTITLSATDADTDNLTFSINPPGEGTLGPPSAPDCNTSAGTATCTTTVLYTPDADYNGPDSFTYTAGDSASATVRITVNAVNDKPVAEADSKTTPENTPLVFPASDLVANDSEGAANENAQTLTVTEVTNPQHGTVVLDGGEITFTPQTDYNGPASFDYTVCDSGQECSTQTAKVNVTVSPVNSRPTASATPESLDIDEDAVAQTVTLAGADSETGAANLRFKITEAPTHGVLKQETTTLGTDDGFTGSPTDVTYKPDADYNGSDSFRFEVTDRGDPDNCGAPAAACASPKSDSRTVPITVNSVVDPVTITSGGTLNYTENDRPTPVDSSLGVTDPEGAQVSQAEVRITTNYQNGEDALAFRDNDAGDNITLDPGSAGATLTLTGTDSAANYQAALRAVTYENTSENPSGLTRTVSFTATDANSVASSPATRSVAVTPVEDLPVAVDDSDTVEEDAAATNIPVLDNDTDLDGGAKTISSASDPANGTVVLTGGSPGAHAGLTYQPDANYCNDPPASDLDTFTYTLNGGSTGTVSMTVTCVNDAPVADNESFNGSNSAIGNTALIGNDPSDGAPSASGLKKTVSGDLLDGDTDVDGPGPLEVVAGTFSTNDGGSVTLESDGDFTYVNDPADSCADTSDSFDYTVTDKNAGTAGTDTGQVNVSISGCVWYVNNDASGNAGTSMAPFNTLAQAETASASGHTIFVSDGDGATTGYAAGIDLKANQKLIGEAATLTVGSDTLHTADAAKRPTITDNNADVVALDDANEVRGVELDPQGTGGGIAGASGDTGGGTIDDVMIIDTGTAGTQPGLDLDSTTGTFNVSNLTLNNNDATSPPGTAIGVRLNNAGTVNFASAGVNSITVSGARGLDALGTNMGTGSVIDGIIVSGSGSGGVRIGSAASPVTGTTTLGDGAGTDLSLTTTSGSTAAFELNTAGTVNVGSAGDDNVRATGGPAVDISGTSGGTYEFDDVDSTNSVGDGINLDGLGSGTFTAASGDIGGYSGTGFDLNGGSGAITYPGNLNNGTGSLAADVTGRTNGAVSLTGPFSDTGDTGGGINVAGNTGGSTTLNNATKQFNTGSGDAVLFNNSDGHTLTLSGGLDIDTSSGQGLAATTSGTLNVTGSGNTIDTGSGRALNATNTDIGSDGLSFKSISANGATNGILLNNTGASGSLAVAGNNVDTTTAASRGTNSSGGIIQNTTGAGISLSGTLSPSFTNVHVLNTDLSGVAGTDVTNFMFKNGKVSDSGTNHVVHDSNIRFNTGTTENNLDGTVTITGNLLERGYDDGVGIHNYAGTISDLNVSNNTVSSATSPANSQGNGIQIVAFGNTSTAAGVTRATINNNTINNVPVGVGLSVQCGNSSSSGPGGSCGTPGSATNEIEIANNTLTGLAGTGPTDPNFGIGSEGILASVQGGNAGSRGQGNFEINANALTNVFGHGISNSTFGNSTVTSRVTNNTIDMNSAGGQIGSQGIGGGLGVVHTSAETPLMTVQVSNNTVTDYDGDGVRLVAFDTTGILNATVTNNSVGPQISAGFPNRIRVDSGNGPGENNTVNLKISGNIATGTSNPSTTPGIGLRKEGADANVNRFAIEGLSPSPAPNSQVIAYVTSQNPGMSTGSASLGYNGTDKAEVINGSNFVATSGNVPAP